MNDTEAMSQVFSIAAKEKSPGLIECNTIILQIQALKQIVLASTKIIIVSEGRRVMAIKGLNTLIGHDQIEGFDFDALRAKNIRILLSKDAKNGLDEEDPLYPYLKEQKALSDDVNHILALGDRSIYLNEGEVCFSDAEKVAKLKEEAKYIINN